VNSVSELLQNRLNKVSGLRVKIQCLGYMFGLPSQAGQTEL
jgi:hypothetical protein